MKRVKASFLITIVIFSIFFIINFSEPVKANNKVCCEKTKDGEYCQYTSNDKCDPTYASVAAHCEDTSFCKLGCAISNEDGLCYKNSFKAAALSESLAFLEDEEDCSIPQCKRGCCVLGSEYSFITEQRCKIKSALYHSMDFRDYIKTEQDCLAEAVSQDTGCCIVDQNSCSFGTRDSCLRLSNSSIAFKKDVYCSDTTLSCECTPRHHKGCYGEDVYWFDSCGNREAVAIDCDYSLGNYCGLDETTNQYNCLSVNCDSTLKYPKSPETGKARKNGESWCIYEDTQEHAYGAVGSRFYRSSCILGKEVRDDCADYRREYCLSNTKQTVTGKFIESACTVNAYEDCIAIKSKKACESSLKDCVWLKPTNNVGEKEIGCIPLIAPGFRFWEEEGKDHCGKASAQFTCKESDCASMVMQYKNLCYSMGDCGDKVNYLNVYSSGGFASSYEVIAEGGIVEGLKNAGERLMLFGGIGIVGLLSLGEKLPGGFHPGAVLKGIFTPRSKGESSIWNGNFWRESVIHTSYTYTTDTWLWEWDEAKQDYIKVDQTFSYKYEDGKWTELGYPKTEQTFVARGDEWVKFEGREVPSSIKNIDPTNLDEKELEAAKIETETETKGGKFKWGNAITVAIMAYTLYELFNALLNPPDDIQQVTVTCSSWEAPVGGSNCEKCNKLPNDLPCTEYKCHSLGESCELLNKNTGNETCVYVNKHDVSSPEITANPEALKVETPQETTFAATLSETTFPGGFEGFRVNELIPHYAALIIGIKTDEPAQCKISPAPGVEYESMIVDFGNSLYTYEHDMLIPYQLTQLLNYTPSNEFTFYVRCRDKNGNANNKDYWIQYKVDRGPDLAPPVILAMDTDETAQIPYNITSLDYGIYLNEPGNCRYSIIDVEYINMPSSQAFSCSDITDPSFPLAYRCIAEDIPIEADQTNELYIRCKDGEENAMTESVHLTLLPSDELTIVSAEPTGTLFTAEPVIEITTAGGADEDGTAECGFSTNQFDYITFAQTGGSSHEQQLGPLQQQEYTYYIECSDVANNIVATKLEFDVAVDTLAPRIVSISKDETVVPNLLKLETDEDTTCEFNILTSAFSFGSGTLMTGEEKIHSAILDSDIYYIKCSDKNDNILSFVVYL